MLVLNTGTIPSDLLIPTHCDVREFPAYLPVGLATAESPRLLLEPVSVGQRGIGNTPTEDPA